MPRTSRLTLERLNAQIAELQRKADALRDRERTDVITKIQTAMDHYGITEADLRAPLGQKAAKKVSAKPSKRSRTNKTKPAVKKKGVIRFRDSEGNAWTGVGKRPNWYKNAIAAGNSPEDLAVR